MSDEKQYSLILSVRDLEVINESLMRMQYRDAAPIIYSINEQIKAIEEAEEAEKEAAINRNR